MLIIVVSLYSVDNGRRATHKLKPLAHNLEKLMSNAMILNDSTQNVGNGCVNA